MSPYLMAVSIVVIAGAVVALSARDARISAVGLLAALAPAPLVTAGTPDPLGTAARVLAAIVAVLMLRRAAAADPRSEASRIGPAAEALAATAAFLAAAAARSASLGGLGAAEATGAGAALLALAAGPLLDRSDLRREGLGLALAITGADLVRAGFAGPPSTLEAVVVAATLVLVGAAVVVAARAGDGAVAASHVHPVAAHRSP